MLGGSLRFVRLYKGIKMPKVKMNASYKGSDTSRDDVQQKVKLYKKGEVYEVHEDLAKSLADDLGVAKRVVVGKPEKK